MAIMQGISSKRLEVDQPILLEGAGLSVPCNHPQRPPVSLQLVNGLEGGQLLPSQWIAIKFLDLANLHCWTESRRHYPPMERSFRVYSMGHLEVPHRLGQRSRRASGLIPKPRTFRMKY